jgi:hypothetical protein
VQSPHRPNLRPRSGVKWMRLGIGAAILTVCIVADVAMIAADFPRLLPLIVVGLLGAEILLYIYRDRLFSN